MVLAGLFSMSLLYPLDLIKTRVSLDMGPHDLKRSYKSFWDCLKKTTKLEGARSLYKGLFVTLFTYVPFSFLSIYTFHYCKQLTATFNKNKEEQML